MRSCGWPRSNRRNTARRRGYDIAEEARRCRDELGRREGDVLRLERLTLRANREPHDVALRYQVALGLLGLGRERDGVGALLFVVEQEPHFGPAQAALAEYFERTGQPGRAARHRRASLPGAGAGTTAPVAGWQPARAPSCSPPPLTLSRPGPTPGPPR
jgi:hypothetical protein